MVVCLDYLHGKVPHYLILNTNSKLVSMEPTGCQPGINLPTYK